jgi:hypothetical protein
MIIPDPTLAEIKIYHINKVFTRCLDVANYFCVLWVCKNYN